MKPSPMPAAAAAATSDLPAREASSHARPLRAAARWIIWICCAAAGLIFLWQPVSAEAQLMLSLMSIAVMTVAARVGNGKFARWVFVAAGSFVMLRYIYWRTTQTLPDWNDPVGFGFGSLLFLAEMYCVSVLAVSLVINADPLTRTGTARRPASELPDVDVFIPTYNEDVAILAMTAAAARSMDYPTTKLTVWLLDDGGTDQKCCDSNREKATQALSRRAELQKLCTDLNLRYLTRAKNLHAKAGNLNNGLAHSRAPIVVVFDADHVPFRSFLQETVGYFAEDPKLFLVQTPHVFLNPDPIERNLRTFHVMPAENEMFYAMTQRGLDKWNGSFFCGSAALLRRAALETTGGFSGITITEDCETAFDLHGAGWTSVYVDKPLIAGLQPETFSSFIGQRSRWCQGMFQLLLLKNPLFKRGLSMIQRLAYLSSMTYWFFPLPRLVFMIAPLLHIFFDVKIFVSTVQESIAYAGTYFIVNMMIQNRIYGHVRWPWISELYEYVQGVYLAKAIFSVVLSPRKPTFNVTAKGISLTEDHLSGMAWPFFAIFGLLLAGVLTAAWRYMFEPGVTALMLVVGLWALFNLLIAGVALGVVAERREPNRHPKLAIQRSGQISIGGRSIDAVIETVSVSGCGIRVSAAMFEGSAAIGSCARIAAAATNGGSKNSLNAIVVSVVRDRDFALVELAFDQPAATDYLAIADLMYGDSECIAKFLASRRKRMGILRGTGVFLKWSVSEPVRAFYYLAARKFGTAPGEHSAAPEVKSNVQTFVLPSVSGPPLQPAKMPIVADAPPFGPEQPVAGNPASEAEKAGLPAAAELWAGKGLSLSELEAFRDYLGLLAAQRKQEARVA